MSTPKAQVEVEIPMTPNFVRLKGTDSTVPIASLDDDVLRALGREWTRLLIEKAQRHRSEPTP